MQQAAETTAQNDPRELEAELLLKAAGRLDALQKPEGFDVAEAREAANYNRKLWTVFLSSVWRDENPLPKEVKNQISSLGLYVVDESFKLEIKPDLSKVAVLVEINRNVAEGLAQNAA